MSLTTIQPSGINTGSQFSFNSIAITSTASGALTVAGSAVFSNNVTFNGPVTSTGTFTVVATTASNISLGNPGQIPYQVSSGVTAFISTGSTGSVLVSTGGGAPQFQNTLALAGTTTATNTLTGALTVACLLYTSPSPRD